MRATDRGYLAYAWPGKGLGCLALAFEGPSRPPRSPSACFNYGRMARCCRGQRANEQRARKNLMAAPRGGFHSKVKRGMKEPPRHIRIFN